MGGTHAPPARVFRALLQGLAQMERRQMGATDLLLWTPIMTHLEIDQCVTLAARPRATGSRLVPARLTGHPRSVPIRKDGS
jgi:hypothetical protein